MTQGVLYVKWGTAADKVLQRSVLSLRAMHPAWEVHVAELPAGSTLLDKATMFDLSPFDETLYLDVDTVVLDRLDAGFAKARRFGMACCINEVPWARRYGGLASAGDLVEFNTGVLFFTRAAAGVFERWKRLCGTVDSSMRFFDGAGIRTMPVNDQGAFAQAVEEEGVLPYVLPLNWNFRPLWQKSFFGPLKVWHDYAEVPEAVRRFSAEQSRAGVVIQGMQLGGS